MVTEGSFVLRFFSFLVINFCLVRFCSAGKYNSSPAISCKVVVVVAVAACAVVARGSLVNSAGGKVSGEGFEGVLSSVP